MRTWRLNTIATRLAVTFVLAVILGYALLVLVAFGKAYFGSAANALTIVSSSGGYIFSRSLRPRFVRNPSSNPQMLMLASRISAAGSFIDSITEDDRIRLVPLLTRSDFRVSVRDAPMSGVDKGDTENLGLMLKLIKLDLGKTLHRVEIGMCNVNDEPIESNGAASVSTRDALAVQIALRDGHWLLVIIPNYDYAGNRIVLPQLAALLIILIVPISVLSVLAARHLAAPIKQFGRAAERLGMDTMAPPLVESGPSELRTAIRAFNSMQGRIRRFVEDRTQMLAAISHDLRTPLIRLRLRAQFSDDKEQQLKMFADLEAMNVMIDSTLAFLRDDSGGELRRLVDLGILVEDVCEDAVDAGGKVSYSGPPGVNVHCRPIAVARAVANLVDNAVKYGGTARVCLIQEAGHVVIVVEDDGPGIPSNEQDKVFAPFYRLEQSRNAATGGVGLGLSAARTIAREHGGDVSLANREGGGLCVRMELPL
jgi:signal transduction histidine kinase